MGDWIGVALVLGVALAIFILKFIFIRCFFNRSRRRQGIAWLGNEGFPPPTRNYFQGNHMYFYPDFNPNLNFNSTIPEQHGAVRCFGKARQKPPPSFEKALKCSTPVVHTTSVSIELEEKGEGAESEEPPPTYEECQVKAACSSSSVKLPARIVTTTEV